jgi:putative ABC transport system permease protein
MNPNNSNNRKKLFPLFRGGMSWRNIWRNKRRTLITAASIFFAVFFSIMMRGFQMGVWLNLVDGVLRSYSGYIQIHAKGYWDNRTFDYSMSDSILLEKKIPDTTLIKAFIPRLESCCFV